MFTYLLSFPGDSDGKESVCNAGDPGSIPGLRRSPGEGSVAALFTIDKTCKFLKILQKAEKKQTNKQTKKKQLEANSL